MYEHDGEACTGVENLNIEAKFENKCYKREYVSSDPCVGGNKSNIGNKWGLYRWEVKKIWIIDSDFWTSLYSLFFISWKTENYSGLIFFKIKNKWKWNVLSSLFGEQ